jgi:hypothetical protein
MAKRNMRAGIRKNDLRSWNFVIFLTLAFILLVVVLSAMSRLTLDVRSRAGLTCPTLTLPKPEDCPGGKWIYQRNTAGCVEMLCDITITPEVRP